jgi:hypothetical protein
MTMAPLNFPEVNWSKLIMTIAKKLSATIITPLNSNDNNDYISK